MAARRSEIANDEREIQSIEWHDETCHTRMDGTDGGPEIRIKAYDDHGIGGVTPYYAVYRNGELWCRVPAYKVTAYYVTEG